MRLFLETFALAGGITASIVLPLSGLSRTPEEPPLGVVLAQAGKASPYGFEGRHSRNLKHIFAMAQDQSDPPAGSSAATPATANTAVLKIEVPTTPEYLAEFSILQKACPALADKDAKTFRVDEWFTRSVPEVDLRLMPRQFLEAAYFTIARVPDNARKIAALTMLNKAIPDSPTFVSYLDQKRTELQKTLEQDAKIQEARKNWPRLPAKAKQAVLSHAIELTLKTLLPENETSLPRLLYMTNNTISKLGYGLYSSRFNESYLDGTDEDIKGDIDFALQITIHETFHAFESMIAEWYSAGKLSRNADLNRQGKLYYLNNMTGGSNITANESAEGYRTNFSERGSWSFQLAAGKIKSTNIQDDMFILRTNSGTVVRKITEPPVYNQDAKAGTLPAACLSAG